MSQIYSYHPLYDVEEMFKFRYLYQSGKLFIHRYLKKLSSRESEAEFHRRREITYCPSHAKAAILDIQNSIYQRLVDVIRNDLPDTFNMVVDGANKGVDRRGRSMSAFMGTEVLPELLFMNKVGIFLDKIPSEGKTLADGKNIPYAYVYTREQIINETYSDDNELIAVTLQCYTKQYDDLGMLKNSDKSSIRNYRLVDGKVHLHTFDSQADALPEPIVTELTQIPFVILEMREALLRDIADYQIALLNLASADINYALKSNYPFYTEQYMPGADNFSNLQSTVALDNEEQELRSGGKQFEVVDKPATEVVISGGMSGRKYQKGLEAPSFINPSSEPLEVSMKKQEVLKREIREVLNLNIGSIQSRRASEESKKQDSVSKEEGLSRIGLELEYAERKLIEFWSEYDGFDGDSEIIYPKNYSLRSDAERQAEAGSLVTTGTKINSVTFKRHIAKEAARLSLGTKVDDSTLKKIYDEIDSTKLVFVDPDDIRQDLESGMVDTENASKARGYPEGCVEQAKKDHAEKLKRIANSQGGMQTATGVDRNENRDAKSEREGEQSNQLNESPSVRGKQKAKTNDE